MQRPPFASSRPYMSDGGAGRRRAWPRKATLASVVTRSDTIEHREWQISPDPKVEEGKMGYEEPEIRELGRLSELTLGQNGSSLDGNRTFTQTGGGNDEDDPTDDNP